MVTAYDSDFNPRSLAGATLVTTVTSLLTSNFNPRSLAGATGNQKNGGRNCLHFNPRSLAGATLRNYDSKLEHFISIHAPSRERLNLHCYHSCAKIFQSTLPCGSDSTLINQLFGAKYFNPRSLAGATVSCSKRSLSSKQHFNPRSLAGATQFSSQRGVHDVFQSTLPCGSDCHCA